ncbi:MAG: DNA-processing protein DprA [Alloprevotella sp.]|nr:DNA-processing protein DprA [Alloprevotella sp.]
MKETVYALALTRLHGLSQANAQRCYEHYGSAEAVFADRNPSEQRLRDALPYHAEALRWAEEEMAFCEENRIRVLCMNDPDYPERLRQCADAPLVLFYRGTADLNAHHLVSVVGTRHITEYGRDLCRHFTEDIAHLLPDAIIVSGLAYGVDIHAHRGALQQGLETIGVLAHGFDRIYPAHHRETAAQMTHQGGLLTEYPIRTVPDKGNFVRRNRIIAGLSEATVIVESAAKGGALITASLALDYNRDVYAFPGRTSDPYSAGCNALIRTNGAGLITSAEDFALAQGWITEREDAKGAPVQREFFPELSDEERRLVDILHEADKKTISQLVTEAGLPFNRTNALLLGLELKGILKGLPGGLYRLLK